jgi:preprotein translocase subunit SecE
MGVRISPPVQSNEIFKPELMNKFTNYLRESYKELTEKVTWPNWTQLQQSTMIVLVATLVITFMVSIMDLGAGRLLNFIYESLF